MNKKIFSAIFILLIMVTAIFTGCSSAEKNNEKINIVSTIFPQYDFARNITGDKANLTMLIPPGGESHTYEPTPQDIINIENADVFIYIGGESDAWVDTILSSVNTEKTQVVKLIDCVDTVKEEIIEGMEAHEENKENDDNAEIDEHIWTSPKNAIKMVTTINQAICKADANNSDYYNKNTEDYIKKLNSLDAKFKETVEGGKRKELIFGDRFPLRYFTEEYGLKYYAAFPGCSSETEPSASTIAFLTDKVKEDNIPVVLKIELSSSSVADTIANETNAKVLTFYSCHNLSKNQFDNGEDYISMMKENIDTLKTALN